MSDAPRGPRFTELALGAGVRGVLTEAAGGVSPAPWAAPDGPGLDLGLNAGDDADRVRANRALLAGALGAPVVYATQVHGAHVREVDDPAAATLDSVGEADGLVTTVPGLALAVLVADCVPVVLADPRARVVGVAHAGRRGVELDVVGAVLDVMRSRGASPADVRAVVGPSACGRCYEVPDAMRDAVASLAPGAWSTTSWGTPALDLPAAVDARLRDLGVGHVVRDGRCTIEDASLFSHRRATAPGGAGTTGRLAGVVHLLDARG
ncbi:peptidoglycan editing factor PgeF [Sanguibacter sp. HDW7]|uniref:peptidoglycan editing factor PgeF n=1 Tax=Sanguibacter sp. HDW7 TaxID=2714931 RepID=UPI00140A6653|nr:peptidoglycan editing factor PgeF [Sanguibacter sp. HDW7]QIK83315.1 peptidoglycan editing factor PgeF [Sanguibacter sp. HDW7]